MEYNTDLEKYEAVNKCESLKELADIIRNFGGPSGLIKGRTKIFDAERMARACEHFYNVPKNTLTRNWGIRQQAMMIEYYHKDITSNQLEEAFKAVKDFGIE